jgi:sec-independent protein translocase protein TatA
MDIGIGEMIVIGLVLVLFFGPKKLPEFGESIGKALKEFKRTLHSTTSDVKEAVSLSDSLPSTARPPAEPAQAHAEHIEEKTSSLK